MNIHENKRLRYPLVFVVSQIRNDTDDDSRRNAVVYIRYDFQKQFTDVTNRSIQLERNA